MALSYVNSSSNKSTTTSVSISTPSGLADGDIMIAFVTSFWATNKTAGTVTAPAGWNTINTQAISKRYQVGLFWKRASSEGSSYSFTSTSAKQMQGAISAYRGAVSSGNPYSVYSNTLYGTSGTIVRAATMTPSSNGLYVVWGGWYYLSGTISLTKPSAMSLLQTQNNTNNALTMAHAVFTPGTATGNQDGTAGATCTVKHAYMVEILAASDTKTQIATARIQKTGLTATQTATARIQKTGQTKTQSVTARIQLTGLTATQTATANIIVPGVSQSNQTATARIQSVGLTAEQTATARIQRTGQTATQTATANIIANSPPNQPTLNSPDDGGLVSYDGLPTLNFTISDNDLNKLECNIQIDNLITFDSQSGNPLRSVYSAIDSGFTSGHPYNSGSTIDYTVQSALPMGIYYWRVAAIDPTGSNTYGVWSEIRSFRATIPITGTSDMTSGTVAVAINSNLTDDIGSIDGDGNWLIDLTTKPDSGDSITAFISDASSEDVSTAVTTYSDEGLVQGMVLNTHTLSIGSDENRSLTLGDLAKYDYDQDSTHVIHSSNGSPATLVANYYSDEVVQILSGNTLTIDAAETLTACDVLIGGTLISDGASNYNISGNWTNSGTFTAGTSTVNLNGTTKQTLSGTLNGGSAFYDLHITNISGSSATDEERTDFVPSVDFNTAAKVMGRFTADQPNTRIEFESGATYEFNDVYWSGGFGNKLCFRNSLTSGTWLLKVSGLQYSVSNIDVSRSDASVSGGKTINGFDGTNYDAGNNTSWLFINTRVRQEVNLIDGVYSSLSTGVVTTGISSLYTNLGGTLSTYFQVVATNTDSSSKTVYLKNLSGGSVIAQLSIPSGISSPTFFRSDQFTYPSSNTNIYVEVPQTTSNGQVTVTISKVVVLQDFGENNITGTETQVEIGNYETGKNNTSSLPLNYPKYWYFSSVDWSPTPTCYAEVSYSTSATGPQPAVTITLQKDNAGDLSTWSDVVTVVNGATSLTPTISSRVSFTASNGCNYRLASSIKKGSYNYSIYNAKVIAVQSSSDVKKLVPQYLVLNTYKNSTGLQNYDVYWNYLEWGGSNYAYYHEINTSSDTSDAAKLQYDPNGSPDDIANSSVSGAYRVRSSQMTMPVAGYIDANITNVPLYASRIIVRLNNSLSGTGVKIWNGTGWGYKPVKYWSGSTWSTAPIKVWDGSQWVEKG